ncbi:MAG: DUF924 family protein [Tissierellaceae bacterium]|jgi:uncharacterized protein (DUF924 family)|nr:DUF924 domain-containing protein [Tissierellia bacterium]
MAVVNWKEVLDFWFDPKHIPLHFQVNEEFDELIREKFLATWEAGADGLLVEWREDIRGRLAEIIVLDQFSRNLFRNDIRSYTQDKMAVALSQEAVNHPDYAKLKPIEKKYILLPFMHSESLALHDWAFKYFEELGDEEFIYFENLHREVLEEFGRYPYQNADLGRESTPEELRYLEEKAGKYYS